MSWSVPLFWWGSAITAAVLLLMGVHSLWFLHRRPQFILAKREGYLAALWIALGCTVIPSMLHVRVDTDPLLAIGRAAAAVVVVIAAYGLWREEWRMLLFPTIPQIQEWLNEPGVIIPDGARLNEMARIARRWSAADGPGRGRGSRHALPGGEGGVH